MLKTYKTDNHSNRIILYTKNIHNLLIVSILLPPPSNIAYIGRLIIHKVKQTSASLALSLILYPIAFGPCLWTKGFFMLCKR